MIQRIQSLYLFASAIACVVCMSMPIGQVLFPDLQGSVKVMNLFAVMANGETTYVPCALFAVLLIAATLNVLTIFAYKNRVLQMRMSLFTSILLVCYYGVVAVVAHMLCSAADGADFKPMFSLAFPLVSAVLNVLAVLSIRRDEKLVRSLDRIR